MKLLKKIVLFTFVTALFVTCKKEELPQSTTVGQPVFSFSGNINGTPINWQAGVNNYYMFSKDSQSSAGVYSFTGILQNTAVAYNSIQISINDDTAVSQNAPSNISKSLLASTLYPYTIPGGNITSYSVSFTSIKDDSTPVPSSAYSYTFGDGSNLDTASRKSGTILHKYMHPGNYQTSISATFPRGQASLSNIVYLGTPDSKLSFYAITATSTASNTLKYYFPVSGNITGYIYNFGDGKHLGSLFDTASHTYSNPGMYQISVTAYDNSKDTVTYNQNILTPYYTNGHTLNYAALATPIANPLSLSNVTIVYTDGNGIKYTSNNALQPTSSSFQITSVSSYPKTNLNGNPTMQLNVTFSCMLYNGTQSIQASGTAVIAVAYH